MFNISYNKAREIQEDHYLFYSSGCGDFGKAATKKWLTDRSIVYGGDRDDLISVIEINEMVPRGGSFEDQRFIHLRMFYKFNHNRQFVSGI
jgi:hypothetical protein